jgi:hypothetical protein
MKTLSHSTLTTFLVALFCFATLQCSNPPTRAVINKPGAAANEGVSTGGNFLNPDAKLVFYDPPKAPQDVRKGEYFSHTQHGVDLPDERRQRDMKFKGRNIQCSDCHSGECRGTGVDINRPGHSSCSGISDCHPDFFENRRICLSCHSGAGINLRPYGSSEYVAIKDFGFDYNHTTHLGPEGQPIKRNKPQAGCDTCHKESKDGRDQGRVGHTQCGQCHCEPDSKVKMNDCVKCHTGTEAARSGHAYLNYRPHAQQFMHKDHRINEKGQPMPCVSCHLGLDKSTSITQISVPTMIGCLESCHNGKTNDVNGKKIFDGWTECSQCHAPGTLAKSRKKGK